MRILVCENWWPSASPFEVMLGSLLVQQTSWQVIAPVLEELRRSGCMDPAVLATMDPADLEALLRPCGFFRQKARRLKAMARRVREEGGMDALASKDTEELQVTLLDLEGVGRETADAMLAFAFLRPRFVAAAYTLRVLDRTGLMPACTYDSVQAEMHRLRGDDATALRSDYAAFVELAKQYCRPRPRCSGCPLRRTCRTANE